MSPDPTFSILEPVKLRSGAEHVADRLVTAIALGEFVPGQRLPSERELASTLEVSRTTIREAIQRLAALGYLEDLLDLRELIEPLIARTAAGRLTPKDADAIRAALNGYLDAGEDREASRAA